jgi:hypothetical protein
MSESLIAIEDSSANIVGARISIQGQGSEKASVPSVDGHTIPQDLASVWYPQLSESAPECGRLRR